MTSTYLWNSNTEVVALSFSPVSLFTSSIQDFTLKADINALPDEDFIEFDIQEALYLVDGTLAYNHYVSDGPIVFGGPGEPNDLTLYAGSPIPSNIIRLNDVNTPTVSIRLENYAGSEETLNEVKVNVQSGDAVQDLTQASLYDTTNQQLIATITPSQSSELLFSSLDYAISAFTATVFSVNVNVAASPTSDSFIHFYLK